MRIKLTCTNPTCRAVHIYDDAEYEPSEFFIAGDNFVTCKTCGEDFDFCIEVKPVSIDEPIQQPGIYPKLEEE